MRLLRADGDDLVLEAVHDGSHKYAILSHRWLAAEEEVTYADIVNRNSNIKRKAGLQKLNWCRQQAIRDGFQYIWADTACIDSSSSQELTESINSMYRWYEKAEVCYVYLYDMPDRSSEMQPKESEPVTVAPASVETPAEQATSEVEALADPICGSPAQMILGSEKSHDDNQVSKSPKDEAQISETKQESLAVDEFVEPSLLESLSHIQQLVSGLSSSEISLINSELSALRGWDEEAFASSEWFTRAWTLQELIAPRVLRFYNQSWNLIGELQEIAPAVAKITGIHVEVLTKQRPLTAYSIAQKLSWAAGRRSTKIEDKAYSLIGIMDIAMGIVYGEGPRAFQRFQEELLTNSSSDDSLFAFERSEKVFRVGGFEAATLLAGSPDDFRGCQNISLTRWHGGRNQYQVVGKEASFRMQLLSDKGTIKSLWRTLPRWAEPSRTGIVYRQAILDCSIEHSPTTMLVLNLFAFSEQATTFYVNGCGPRVKKLSFWDSRHYKHEYANFSIVRKPDEFDAFAAERMIIVCGFERSEMSVQLVEVSIPGVWNATDTTFVLPDKETPLEAELNVSREGALIGTLRISTECRRGFCANFKESSFYIPTRRTLVWTYDRHDCVLKRVRGGLLVVRIYQLTKFPGNLVLPLLQIEYMKTSSAAWFLLWRVLLSCASFCVYLTVLAFLVLTILSIANIHGHISEAHFTLIIMIKVLIPLLLGIFIVLELLLRIDRSFVSELWRPRG